MYNDFTSTELNRVSNLTKAKISVREIELGTGEYGETNILPNGNILITINKFLKENQKSTIVLHEVYHAEQIVNKYPTIGYLSKFTEYEPDYLKSIATLTGSGLLDADVHRKLLKKGYDDLFAFSDYITPFREMISQFDLDESVDSCTMTLAILKDILIFPENLTKEFISFLKPYAKKELMQAIDISSKINSIGYETPVQAFRCFNEIFSTLCMGRYIYITYQNKRYFGNLNQTLVY